MQRTSGNLSSLFGDESSQMYILEALIASMIVLAAVLFMVYSVPTSKSQLSGVEYLQLKTYSEDILQILSVENQTKVHNIIDTGNHTTKLYEIVKEGLNGNWTDFNRTFNQIGNELNNSSGILYKVCVFNVLGNGKEKLIHECGYPTPPPDAVSSFKLLIIGGKVYEVRLTLWYG